MAKLEIENNEESSLEKVRVEIAIFDTTTAEEATGRFSIGNSTLSGSLRSDLSLPSGLSGSAEWLIVPYSEIGDPKLSILDELKIHELIRNVHIYSDEENDDILDFLVNDQNDLGAYPDALYSSKTLQQYNVTTGEILSVQSIDSG